MTETTVTLDATQVDLLADVIAQRVASRPLATDVAGACHLLGVSWDYWAEHIAPDIPQVRRGRRRLIPIAELEKWLVANAESVTDTITKTIESEKR